MPRPFDLLFTDLDGTLLEERTYSFEAARPALRHLQTLRIPIIFCTSKTISETVAIQERLGLEDPFIVENGGAVYFRPGQLTEAPLPIQRSGAWHRLSLGYSYSRLVSNLLKIQAQLGCRLLGFSDMNATEISQACGLSVEEALRAKDRQYDEPFIVENETPELMDALERVASDHGLRVTRGGRFHHLTGPNDKGQAVGLVLGAYARSLHGTRCVALGDSPNDLSMLLAADLPVVVQRPDGSWDPRLLDRLPEAIKAEGIGPVGWNQAVLTLLGEGG
ncbi:MAG: HAD-IIB family hydrolase [Acidobacteria bacterium]|nr:HAD-IIB family hydrolase [Acidobacteriota bacterium]